MFYFVDVILIRVITAIKKNDRGKKVEENATPRMKETHSFKKHYEFV